MNDLHTKYRPTSFDDVLGQDAAVRSVEEVVEGGSCRAFLFTGPSGVGKTTLARIIANEVGCIHPVEVDAATNSGVDAMRDVASALHYTAMGENKARVVIVDEAHSLSKSAWQSVLKVVEEPPPNAYWIFCTTDASRVPQTVKTRCVCYDLQPVSTLAIYDLVRQVAKDEKVKLSKDAAQLIAEAADGSPRRGLTYLSQCLACESLDEVEAVLRRAGEDKEVVELCRLLVRGKPNWKKAMKVLSELNESNPESIRLQVVAYFTKVAMGAKNADQAAPALDVLEAFDEPCRDSEKMAPIVRALGALLLT